MHRFPPLITGRFVVAVALLVAAGCGSDSDCTPPTNPTGSCSSPTDGSIPGYSSNAPCTYLRNCPLSREYWRVYVHENDTSKAYMLPRPDGTTCLPAAKRTMPAINDLTIDEAMAASTCLHKDLTFKASGAGSAWQIVPFDLPVDVAEVCKAHPALASGVLKAPCERCPVTSINNPPKGDVGCPSIGYSYTQQEAEELAKQLNALYGGSSPP